MRLIDLTLDELNEALRPIIRAEVQAAIAAELAERIPCDWVSRQELARMFDVGEFSIRDAHLRGEISGLKVGKQYRYCVKEVVAALRINTGAPAVA
jgi:hypothetical protein